MVLRHVVNSTEFHSYLYTVHEFNAQQRGHILSYVNASYLYKNSSKTGKIFFYQSQRSNGCVTTNNRKLS